MASAIEKFLFRKVELWIFLLLIPLGLAALIVYGYAVRDVTMGGNRFGMFSKAAFGLAEFPVTMKRMASPDLGLVAFGGQRFKEKSGWQLSDSSAELPGFLLLSRFDGTQNRHVVEFVKLSSGEVLKTWRPNSELLLEGLPINEKHTNAVDMKIDRYRAIHPLLLPNGDLIIKDHESPLVRIDSCGNKVWINDEDPYHHSTELGRDDTIWVPSHIEPVEFSEVKKSFYDNGIVNLNLQGDILSSHSITSILVDNGYRYLLFGTGKYFDDKVHINDIQPVLTDGEFWKADDLLISMRHISAVMLYRPSTNKVLWLKSGPWSSQHDIDIVDDGVIAIFNNNAYDMGRGGKTVGHNEINYYDFSTDTVTSPFKHTMEELDIRTMSEGLFELLPDGSVLVEEENYGRIVIFSSQGSLTSEYINRAENGNVFRLGWSRYINTDIGNKLAQQFSKEKPCNEGI